MAAQTKPGAGQVYRKMANPTPATLLLFNSHKGAKTMAARKAKPKAKPKARRKPNAAPTRTYQAKAKPAARKTKANPLIIYRTKRKNPAGNEEIIDFVFAGTAIGIAQPWLARMAGNFGLPGQYVTPISTAATGVGLWWLSGMFKMTKRFSRPSLLLGVSTGIVALVAPMVRRWIMPGGGQQMPANGPAGRRMMVSGPAGIGAWNGQPMALPMPMATPAKSASKGPAGIGVFPTPAGRFSRR